MVTLIDIELAIPCCDQRIIEKDGQHGIHYDCGKPMRYNAIQEIWLCLACGCSRSASQIAFRSSTRRNQIG